MCKNYAILYKGMSICGFGYPWEVWNQSPVDTEKKQVLNHVELFVTPWTVVHQAPWSMGFPRQEYWSGLPFPSPGDLPDPGIEPMSPALAGRFFTTSATWEAQEGTYCPVISSSMNCPFIVFTHFSFRNLVLFLLVCIFCAFKIMTLKYLNKHLFSQFIFGFSFSIEISTHTYENFKFYVVNQLISLGISFYCFCTWKEWTSLFREDLNTITHIFF